MNRIKLKMLLTGIMAASLLIACNSNTESKEKTGEEAADSVQEKNTETDITETTASTEPLVYAKWEKDALPELSEYDEFESHASEWQVKIAFFAKETVKDFKVLGVNVDFEDEKVIYTVEELHTQKELSPERPLLLTITLVGTIPNNGISYVDQNGKTRYFTVNESGIDGSVQLLEFNVKK